MSTQAKVQAPDSDVLQAFGAIGQGKFLPSGEGRVYKVGDLILKHLLHDPQDTTLWSINVYNTIREDGFKVSRPKPAVDGSWIYKQWTAWKYIDGTSLNPGDYPKMIEPIAKFHQALQSVPKPEFINTDKSPYRRADNYTWNDMPPTIHPQLIDDVKRLYALRMPLENVTPQVIHGDINPDNILIASDGTPVIIDIAPYFRPADFALAIYAYWTGPWQQNSQLLEHFSHIKYFDQLLLRAAIRMLLIMSEFNRVFEYEKYHKATGIVESYVMKHAQKL